MTSLLFIILLKPRVSLDNTDSVHHITLRYKIIWLTSMWQPRRFPSSLLLAVFYNCEAQKRSTE